MRKQCNFYLDDTAAKIVEAVPRHLKSVWLNQAVLAYASELKRQELGAKTGDDRLERIEKLLTEIALFVGLDG